MKEVDDLIKQPGAWLDVASPAGSIVSSRIRLARNLADTSFPGWAGEEESVRVWNELSSVLVGLKEMDSPLVFEMADLSRVDKETLIERHLMSREFAEKGAGSGLVMRRDESIAIMINEEDHLRIQAVSPGLGLNRLWDRINALDTEIEKRVRYAFSPQLGYLTACPTNVGTGMRASVMMHLPGLALMNDINGIIKGVTKIGLAVRGLWGEGSEAAGNMFQISNQTSLGEKEEGIIKRLDQIVQEIAEHEDNARTRLLQQRENVLRDHIGRAFGILSNAYLLNSKETLDLLSALRLGIEMGLLLDWEPAVINELFLFIQPGHLQKTEGRAISAEKRDLARARLVRGRLARRGNQNRAGRESKRGTDGT